MEGVAHSAFERGSEQPRWRDGQGERRPSRCGEALGVLLEVCGLLGGAKELRMTSASLNRKRWSKWHGTSRNPKALRSCSSPHCHLAPSHTTRTLDSLAGANRT